MRECKTNATRDHEEVHSDDGRFHICLCKAITGPTYKISRSSSVQVFYGAELRLERSGSKPNTTAGVQKVEGTGSSIVSGARRFHGATPQDLKDSNASVGGEDEEIIVKVFSIGHGTWSRADKEISALKQLTEADCQHAPRYLGDFTNNVASGVVRYVLMSRLPGCPLSDMRVAWKLPSTQAKVKKAFNVAIKPVHECGVDNNSHMGRNILWNDLEDMVYIVDFERALMYTSSADMPAKWSDLDHWELRW